MRKTKVLIVDDSVVVRRSLTEALSTQSGLEVVGVASSGRTALMKIPLLQPDVVLIDADMPLTDGVETRTAVHRQYPQLAVINVPAQADGRRTANWGATLAREVSAKIGRRAVAATAAAGVPRIDVVVIGVSTGGPSALMELIPQFPEDLPVPILVVQHMPAAFTKLLVDRLASRSNLPVREGRISEAIVPGAVWIAPGDHHMAVVRDGETLRLALHQGPPENSCRPAADVLFRSVAASYGSNVLAVVLTGMGRDGLKGSEDIRAAGGQVFVQDENSSVVWGMPGSVARAGMANRVVPLAQMAPEIAASVWRYRR